MTVSSIYISIIYVYLLTSIDDVDALATAAGCHGTY